MKFLPESSKKDLFREYRRGLREFENRFPDEESCQKRLFEWQWPDGFQCMGCDHDEYYYHRPRGLYQCKKCKHQASLTANTLFHKSRTPLKVWFYMIFVLGYTNNRVPLSNFIKYRANFIEKGDHRKAILKMAEKIIEAASEPKDYLKLVHYYNDDDPPDAT